MLTQDTKILPIGLTKYGDAAVDFKWVFELNDVKQCIVKTKNPCNKFLQDVLLRNSEKCILHAVITGWGKSVLEPDVPSWTEALQSVVNLMCHGFPDRNIVICVDPVMPWNTQPAIDVIKTAYLYKLRNFRVTSFATNEYIKERFHIANIATPEQLGFSEAHCIYVVDEMVNRLRKFCHGADIIFDETLNPIRKYPANTKELLNNQVKCKHNCLYCPFVDAPDGQSYEADIKKQFDHYVENISSYTTSKNYILQDGKEVLENLAQKNSHSKPVYSLTPEESHKNIIAHARKRFIEEGILKRPVRHIGNKTYYFDENEILQERERTSAGHLDLLSLDWQSFNNVLFKMAIKQTPVGTTLTEFCEIYYSTKIVLHSSTTNWSFLERLITRIERPSFERTPENKNRKTFDFIRVTANINSSMYDSRKDLISTIKKHKQDIDQMVLNRIAETNQFKKYGFPINMLQCTACTLTQRFELEYVFELKQELLAMSDNK